MDGAKEKHNRPGVGRKKKNSCACKCKEMPPLYANEQSDRIRMPLHQRFLQWLGERDKKKKVDSQMFPS